MARFIGIRHRVKKTAKGEARPTQVAIINEKGAVTRHDLETETDELDFVHCLWPCEYRKVEPACAGRPDEDLAAFSPHHVKWQKVKDDAEWDATPEALRKEEGKDRFRAARVPDTYDGLRAGDTVAFLMGGSGGEFAFALSRRAQDVGALVVHAPTYVLKPLRDDERDKDKDSELLATLVKTEPDLFRPITERDRTVIGMRVKLRSRMDAMKDRIACEQRLQQRFIGEIFCNEDGVPEGLGDLSTRYENARKGDVILQAMLKEEGRRDSGLAKSLAEIGVYVDVLSKIEGCGPAIAGRIIASVTDITRFATDAKFKAFCGVHVRPDGTFPRHEGGMNCNWHPDVRQAFFLLMDQFNRRPSSVWGQKLREYKVKFRETHPVEIKSTRGLVKLFRAVERFFHSVSVSVDAGLYDVADYDGLYSFYAAGASAVRDQFGELFNEQLADFAEKFSELATKKEIDGRGVKLYTAGHIHHMAGWRTVTRFAEWLYREWTAYELGKGKAAMAA